MAYIRCDVNCDPVSPQPKNINVVDTFGNPNDFFHVGYERCDVDCNPNPIPFDPNNPQNAIYDNPDVLFFDTVWTRMLVDRTAGPKFAYVDSPLESGTVLIITPPTIAYLSSESDSDLYIVDESNDDILEISYTDPLTSIIN